MKISKNKNQVKKVRVILPFIVIIIIVFLIAILLSWKNITRYFARLGIVPEVGIMVTPPTPFIYTIPSSDLKVGSVVHYWSFANDTSGNSNTTNSTPGVFKTFIVIYPENITRIVISATPGGPAVTQIPKNNNVYVRVYFNNSRTKDVYAYLTFQVIDPNGVVVKPLDSGSQSPHIPGMENWKDQSYSTTSNEWFVGNNYKVEVRVFNDTWGLGGGFRISNTINATFNII
jgi:hypothetical protein